MVDFRPQDLWIVVSISWVCGDGEGGRGLRGEVVRGEGSGLIGDVDWLRNDRCGDGVFVDL